jgi:site-specific DNA-methyltransferase (adenine-specific)
LELTEAGIKNDSGRGFSESDPMAAVMRHNPHPTVKPTDLMRYLCRLITPPNGIVLDPFTGSGSTGKAAMAEGFRFIGIEREAEYIEIARARISAEADKPRQLSLF